MKPESQITKGIFIGVYLLFLFYFTINYENVANSVNIPIEILMLVIILSVIYISYQFIKAQLNSNKLEHEFTSIVNHTFRTPITSVLWFVKEMEKEIPDKDKALYLQGIENSMNKILGIVDLFAGIKNINDISGYYFEATSLREVVEKSILKYREEINKKGLGFQVSTFKDIPLLTMDLKKISFVVDTLVENAILYTPKEGKILIDCIFSKDKLNLYVSDTGIGLSFRDKMNIFSRFYRGQRATLLNTDGMGLRLYLSKIIIKRHNGNIYA
nr:HAMP domain-containing histidine kinase [Candidatus Paceibacterota bacterium]